MKKLARLIESEKCDIETDEIKSILNVKHSLKIKH